MLVFGLSLGALNNTTGLGQDLLDNPSILSHSSYVPNKPSTLNPQPYKNLSRLFPVRNLLKSAPVFNGGVALV